MVMEKNKQEAEKQNQRIAALRRKEFNIQTRLFARRVGEYLRDNPQMEVDMAESRLWKDNYPEWERRRDQGAKTLEDWTVEDWYEHLIFKRRMKIMKKCQQIAEKRRKDPLRCSRH
jgi:hypothetical protein